MIDSTDSPRIAGLVLAAGAGSRLGRPKATVSFRGELLVERSVRLLTAGGCDPNFVVLGAVVDDVRSSADLSSATIVVAERWQLGMSESLKAGLAAAARTDAVAAVVVLVDQPLVGARAIERLRAAWSAGAIAAVACYSGKPRNPVLLDRSVWSEVCAAAHDDVGARGWLSEHGDLVTQVECGDTGDPADIDTRQDLETLGTGI